MIIALGVMFVTSLLLAVVFVAANGDIGLTRTDTAQKKAYYAALAGISTYKYHLASESDYWKKCPTIANAKEEAVNVAGTADEKYKVITLHSEGHTEAECKTGKQAAILQTTGSAIGTFRIESTGTAVEGTKTTTRTLVATFTHPGFINYVYLTNYEVLDPAAQNPEPTECAQYYAERKEHGLLGEPPSGCGKIEFAPTDKINGPMHTNDAAAICAEGSSKPVFGRSKEDKIEMNGGHYSAGGSCSDSPEILGEYTTKGPTLTPPESDSELIEAAETGYRPKGRTYIELKASTPVNTIAITNSAGVKEPTKNFPADGVVYVENNGTCPIKYSPFGTNYTGDANCGNVYVKGEYTESLTIAAANDLIINGNLTTTHETSGKPTGSATLGLIATNFVRLYHPVTKEYSATTYTPKTEAPGGPGGTTCTTLAPPTHAGTLTNASKEVKSITTSDLTAGEEVTGTGIAAGTTIESIKSSSILVLSKNATASGAQTLSFVRSGVLTNGKKEVTSIVTSGLSVGEEVSGPGIAAGTTIEKVKSSTILVLSKNATASATEKLKFYKATGYEYFSGINKCVEKPESGYTYYESENLDAKCSSTEDKYIGGGHCEYQNSSEGCRAANLEAFEPTIDAAILSTSHSFIVDNYKCGEHLGNLNVWGSIAQFWRGPVGTGGNRSGYTKNYNYDDRLQTLQPPDFLAPTSSSLKLSRITEVKNGYTG